MSKFKELLKRQAEIHNINLDNEKLEKLEKFKELLLEWNEKMNLTAITNEKEIIQKHFIDSLSIIKYINEQDNIIDIGTGAGFPGIPVAIYFNSKVKITLVDSLNKRINFLNTVIKELELKNITTIHARAEELARDKHHREKYDVVVSRAVASLNILLEYDIPYLKVNGKGIFMKGSNITEEVNNSKNALNELKCKNEEIDKFILDNTIEHNNIIIKKYEKTINKYPRITAKIKKEPL